MKQLEAQLMMRTYEGFLKSARAGLCRGLGACARLRPRVGAQFDPARSARRGQGDAGRAAAEDFGLPHISTGDMLPRSVAEGTELGQHAERLHGRGRAGARRVIIGMIARAASAQDDARDGFLLDGFPRNEEQADALGRRARGARARADRGAADRGARRGRRAPDRRPAGLRARTEPHLPRRVRPAQARGRLRQRRLAS